MERLIMNDLLKWKNKPSRKPLLFTGVRQCGKTYILKEFGSRHFEDVAYFNFEENENIASLFEYDLNVKRILDELGSVVRGKPITLGKTLVIFDEVQKVTCSHHLRGGGFPLNSPIGLSINGLSPCAPRFFFCAMRTVSASLRS